MDDKRQTRQPYCRLGLTLGLTFGLVALGLGGCATQPDFREISLEGQRAMLAGDYRAARGLFRKAHELVPEDATTLHDLGDCCMYFANEQFRSRNAAAAAREIDQAIAYYQRATNAAPGFQAALVGKNVALEWKGQFEQAVAVAEWAAEFVGPSAQQQMFVAAEMEERGDFDAALLRLRQAVAMEPENAAAHEALGRLYARLDQPELAVHHLIYAYRLDPSRPGVTRMLEALGAPVPGPPGQQ